MIETIIHSNYNWTINKPSENQEMIFQFIQFDKSEYDKGVGYFNFTFRFLSFI